MSINAPFFWGGGGGGKLGFDMCVVGRLKYMYKIGKLSLHF